MNLKLGFDFFLKPLKCQTHKMVKHNETIRRLLPTNCLSVLDHFVGLALKGLKINTTALFSG